SEQKERGQQMIESAASVHDRDDVSRREREGLVERKLEVGRVLGGWMAHNASAASLSVCKRARGDRVQIADHRLGLEGEPKRAGRTRPSAARAGAPRRGGALPGGRGPPPATTTTISSPTAPFLRWHYPDQVLRVGGARWPPSQPGCPELPYARGIVPPDHF